MSEITQNINKTTKKETNNLKQKEYNLESDESKYNTVSLKEIKEALQNKVNNKQKQSIVKKVLLNVGILITMLLFLMLIIMGTKNIDVVVLEKDIKIISLSILVIGILLLEKSYKKDNTQIALNAIEILIFSALNLCLVYSIKLYFNNIINIISNMIVGITIYYILKCIILVIKNIRKYKKDNNDIKEIIKK